MAKEKMLHRGFFVVTIICDRPEDEVKKLEGELRHFISHSIRNIIVENVEWEQTEGVLPLSEDSEE